MHVRTYVLQCSVEVKSGLDLDHLSDHVGNLKMHASCNSLLLERSPVTSQQESDGATHSFMAQRKIQNYQKAPSGRTASTTVALPLYWAL